jgi:hypothetical protein
MKLLALNKESSITDFHHMLEDPIVATGFSVDTTDNKLVRIFNYGDVAASVYEIKVRFSISASEESETIITISNYFYKLGDMDSDLDFAELYNKHLSMSGDTFSHIVRDRVKMLRPEGDPKATLNILKVVADFTSDIPDGVGDFDRVSRDLVIEKGIRCFTGNNNDPALLNYMERLSVSPSHLNFIQELKDTYQLAGLSVKDFIRSASWDVTSEMLVG